MNTKTSKEQFDLLVVKEHSRNPDNSPLSVKRTRTNRRLSELMSSFISDQIDEDEAYGDVAGAVICDFLLYITYGDDFDKILFDMEEK